MQFIKVLSLMLIAFCFYNEAVIFKLTNFVCESHTSTILINQCRLEAVNREKVLLNFNATLLQPIDDITGRMQIFKKANGFKPWLVDRKIDFCKFLRKAYDPYVILIYKLAKEFTNVNHSCPLVDSIIVKDFYLRAETFNLPLPTGDYIVQTTFASHKKTAFVANVSFTFVENVIITLNEKN